MGESHTNGAVLGKFCAKRTKKCELHKAEYQNNCTPKPKGWEKEFFWEGSQYDDGSSTQQKKFFEAHHLLCVAAVTEIIVGDSTITDIVRQTDWCINKKKNMFAMPKWGHTIKHYCTIEDDDFFEADTPYYLEQTKAPNFENHPMHDCDHDLYIDEVKEELNSIATKLRTSQKKHEDKTKELADKLESLSETFRTNLQNRGKRSEGTHKALTNAIDGKTTGWYKPFSMAESPRNRSFPGINRKIIARANSLLGRLGQ